MFNRSDIRRDAPQLTGGLQALKGYDWWWHSFTGRHERTGEEKAFFIEFFICNPLLGGKDPVFGQASEKARPSYLMVKAGSWGEDAAQLHRFFGWEEVRISRRAPLRIHAGDCFLSEGKTEGSVCVSEETALGRPEMMTDPGSMSWKLKIRKKTAFNVGWGASALMRFLQAFEMFWHAEGMKTEYEGEVVWKGEKYLVRPEDCFGYADKNWGKDFTSPWVWLSSCHLTSLVTGKELKDSAFDIGGGRPKAGPIALDRKLLSAFWYEGEPFEFNFSRFWTGVRTDFSCHETEDRVVWHVEQENLRDRMVTDITCLKKDMLMIRYEAPDGKMRHRRLWNGGNGTGKVELYHDGALVDIVKAENVGCEYGEYGPAHAWYGQTPRPKQ